MISPERIAFLRHGNHGPGIADLLDTIESLQSEVAVFKNWVVRIDGQVPEARKFTEPCVLETARIEADLELKLEMKRP